MLSIEDIYKEIGKNIFIYPLKNVRILGNSVDLTASEFAWSMDGKYIYDEDLGKIKVPAHKTACILTREAIYVTSKIGGTYHSRVTLAKRGFGHIGTMLDPEYIGQSLIILHNTTDEEQVIDYGERIVSLVFYYLNKPILTQSHNATPGHLDKMTNFEKIDKYERWHEANRWASETRELVDTFLRSDDFKRLKEKRKTDLKQWDVISRYYKKYIIKYVIIFAVCIGIWFVIDLIFPGMNNSDKVYTVGIMFTAILTSIISDIDIK